MATTKLTAETTIPDAVAACANGGVEFTDPTNGATLTGTKALHIWLAETRHASPTAMAEITATVKDESARNRIIMRQCELLTAAVAKAEKKAKDAEDAAAAAAAKARQKTASFGVGQGGGLWMSGPHLVGSQFHAPVGGLLGFVAAFDRLHDYLSDITQRGTIVLRKKPIKSGPREGTDRILAALHFTAPAPVKDENGKTVMIQKKDDDGAPVVGKDGKPVMTAKIDPNAPHNLTIAEGLTSDQAHQLHISQLAYIAAARDALSAAGLIGTDVDALCAAALEAQANDDGSAGE